MATVKQKPTRRSRPGTRTVQVGGWAPATRTAALALSPETLEDRLDSGAKIVMKAALAVNVPEATGRRRVSVTVYDTAFGEWSVPTAGEIWGGMLLSTLALAGLILSEFDVERGPVTCIRSLTGRHTELTIEDLKDEHTNQTAEAVGPPAR